MKLSELIAHVGDEHVKIQRVDACLRGAKTNSKGETTLQLITDQVAAADYFQGAPMPEMHGLLIWLPKARLPQNAPVPQA